MFSILHISGCVLQSMLENYILVPYVLFGQGDQPPHPAQSFPGFSTEYLASCEPHKSWTNWEHLTNLSAIHQKPPLTRGAVSLCCYLLQPVWTTQGTLRINLILNSKYSRPQKGQLTAAGFYAKQNVFFPMGQVNLQSDSTEISWICLYLFPRISWLSCGSHKSQERNAAPWTALCLPGCIWK